VVVTDAVGLEAAAGLELPDRGRGALAELVDLPTGVEPQRPQPRGQVADAAAVRAVDEGEYSGRDDGLHVAPE
jgi:hypothetical protein